MKTTQTPEGVLVAFDDQTSGRVNVILYFEAIFSILAALAFIFIAVTFLNEAGDSFIAAMVCLAVSFVFMIAFKRYTTKATAKESLLIAKDTFSVINKSIFTKSVKRYKVADIDGIWFKGKQHFTDHPLKGQSFDYLGFQTQQEVINTVHDEGNLSFEYNGQTIYFGKSVPSWHAEDFDKILQAQTNGTLRIKNLPDAIDDDTIFSNTTNEGDAPTHS